MKYLSSLIAILFLALACQNNAESPSSENQRQAQDEPEANDVTAAEYEKKVMEVHDRVMPEMGTLGKKAAQLREIADRDSVAPGAYLEGSLELTRAKDAMMEWMRQFDVPADSADYIQINYLKQELKKMEDIEKQTEQALQKADSLLAGAKG